MEARNRPTLAFTDVRKVWPGGTRAVDGVTLTVTGGSFVALLLADRVLVMDAERIVADATAGQGGEIAQALVAVPRDQPARLAEL